MAVLEGWKSECSLVSWFILVQILHNTDRLLRCMQLTLTQGQIQLFSFLKNIYLSIFGCLGSSLLLLALVVVSRGYSWLQCTASSCGGFFCWQSMASRCLGLSSCTWTQQLWHVGWANLSHMESSQTRDRTHVLCVERQTLIHCTTREVPTFS